MSDQQVNRLHWSFWVIGTVTLIWNLMGVINFFMQMNPDVLAAYRESERALIESRPSWATIAFALAVFGSVIGCVLLLLRNSVVLYYRRHLSSHRPVKISGSGFVC